MKTYVVILSEFFPKIHPKAGEPTHFFKQIEKGLKIHTIRSNYDLWIKRIESVQRGEAVVSLRAWSGKPYRSKQIEKQLITKDDGIGFSIVERSDDFVAKVFTPGEKHFARVPYSELAENDGLLESDFNSWFSGWEYNDQKIIIHFTPKRYLHCA